MTDRRLILTFAGWGLALGMLIALSLMLSEAEAVALDWTVPNVSWGPGEVKAIHLSTSLCPATVGASFQCAPPEGLRLDSAEARGIFEDWCSVETAEADDPYRCAVIIYVSRYPYPDLEVEGEFAAVYLRNTLDEPIGWCPAGLVKNCWMHDGNVVTVHECDASSVEMPPVTTWGEVKSLLR